MDDPVAGFGVACAKASGAAVTELGIVWSRLWSGTAVES